MLQNSLEVLEGRDRKWGTWASVLTLLSQISDGIWMDGCYDVISDAKTNCC